MDPMGLGIIPSRKINMAIAAKSTMSKSRGLKMNRHYKFKPVFPESTQQLSYCLVFLWKTYSFTIEIIGCDEVDDFFEKGILIIQN